MNTLEKLLIVGFVLFAFFMISYNLTMVSKTGMFLDNMNSLCGVMTEELRAGIDEDSKCVDYYCYYAPYSPPEGYEDKTTSLCACKCRLASGKVLTSQILGAGTQNQLLADV